jgi:hypothetical protein
MGERTLKNFKQIFSKPGHENRPWIIWIWNMALSRGELLAQLNGLLSQGFGGIIIRPGREMVPAYLSEEFFGFFKAVLDAAKEHGTGIRIADDFSMPWSDCFRTLLNQNEKLRARNLVLKESVIRKEGEVFEQATDHPDTTIIIASKIKNTEISLPDIKHLTFSGNAPLMWKAPAGEWQIHVFKQEYVLDPAGGYMPNVFNARTAQLYIQNVLNEFKTRFAKHVGTTFKGFLTEMPAYRPSANGLPWDDDLVVKFRTKYKKDLLKFLPALYCSTEQAGRIRNQIYSYLDESMYERFAYSLEMWAKNSKLSQWVLCPERTLLRSDNLLLDGDFRTHVGLSMVGIQNLDGTEGNFAMVRAMADCNASEYRRGTLAMIGRNAVGAAATIQSLKDEVVLNLMAGASPIVIDGGFFSLDQRSCLKTPHNPIWYPFIGNHFKSLCDYASTLQELLKNVSFSRPLAILSPTGAIRATYLPTDGEPSRRGLHLMQRSISAVLRQSIDFEILSDEYLTSCSVKPTGEFGKTDRKGRGFYSALLLPFAPLISRSALVFLEKLVGRGGKIIFVNELPRGTFEDGVNIKIAKRIEKLVNPKKEGSRIVMIDELDRSLDDISSRLKIRGIENERPDIISADGIEDDCNFYMIHNRSDLQEHILNVQVPQEKHLSSIDCETGAITEIPDVDREGPTCRFAMRLMPQRTVLIVGSPTAVAAAPVKPGRPSVSPFIGIHRNYRIVLKNQWSFEPLTFNALPLSNWTLRIGLSRESGGFSHFYESHFQIGTVPPECYCAISDLSGDHKRMRNPENPVEISLNGTRLDRPLVPTSAPQGIAPEGAEATAAGAVSFIVPQSQVNVHYLFGAPVTLYSMRELLVKGTNRFSIRTSGLALDPQTILYPPLVLGNFAIVRGQNGWIIDKTTALVGIDSWTRYGYPYLSGVGVYRQMFEIPHQYSRLILRMTRVSGVVDIKINGKEVGNFLWQPIEADVTSLCEPRRNELVVTVANTIDNILRLNGRPSGILGEVNIDVL